MAINKAGRTSHKEYFEVISITYFLKSVNKHQFKQIYKIYTQQL
jgi:hypothetical protein